MALSHMTESSQYLEIIKFESSLPWNCTSWYSSYHLKNPLGPKERRKPFQHGLQLSTDLSFWVSVLANTAQKLFQWLSYLMCCNIPEEIHPSRAALSGSGMPGPNLLFLHSLIFQLTQNTPYTSCPPIIQQTKLVLIANVKKIGGACIH